MVNKKGTTNASSSDDAVMTVNERILRDCHNIYTDPENGLVHIAKDVGIDLLAPRKKINIMLIGNHSAGKSSFINWYIEETVSTPDLETTYLETKYLETKHL
jgi:predicted GTPase